MHQNLLARSPARPTAAPQKRPAECAKPSHFWTPQQRSSKKQPCRAKRPSAYDYAPILAACFAGKTTPSFTLHVSICSWHSGTITHRCPEAEATISPTATDAGRSQNAHPSRATQGKESTRATRLTAMPYPITTPSHCPGSSTKKKRH